MNDEKVNFDLSILSLQELIEVYQNVTDFLQHIQNSKIIIEDKEKKDE